MIDWDAITEYLRTKANREYKLYFFKELYSQILRHT
jgi:uncharacterized protein YozE (UPF0346 family)